MNRPISSESQSVRRAPSIRTVPPSGMTAPAMTRISVDLPAPLGPTIVTTSPGSKATLTPARTRATAGAADGHLFDLEPAHGVGKGRKRERRSGTVEEVRELAIRAGGPRQRRPRAEQLFDRLQRPPGEERGGEDRREILLSIASHAPSPSASDCSVKRRNLLPAR